MFELLNSMSFREKSLWVSSAIMLYLWIWYFGEVGGGIFDGSLDRDASLGIFIAMVVIVIVLEVIAQTILAIVNPRDSDARADERDREIAWRAGSCASWLLGGGVITIAMYAMFNDITSVGMVHALILLLLAVEIICDALQILYYRRGF